MPVYEFRVASDWEKCDTSSLLVRVHVIIGIANKLPICSGARGPRN